MFIDIKRVRMLARTVLSLILISLVHTQADAGDVSASDFLNDKLASKPVTYERTVKQRRQKCSRRYCPPPGRGGEGSGECVGGDCHWEYYDVLDVYSDRAQVTTTETTEVRDLVFDQSKVSLLPERALLAFREYENCGDDPLSINLSLSVQGSSGYSIAKSDGVSTTVAGGVTLTFSGQFGSLGTSLNVTRSVSTSTSTTESFSESVSRSDSYNISVGGRKQGKVEFLAYETTAIVPYSARVVVDGTLVGNKSNLSKASQLLSEAERTLPFRGHLRITNVSSGRIRRTEVDGAPACKVGAVLEERSWSTSLPASGLSAEVLETFKKPGTEPLLPLTSQRVDPAGGVLEPNVAADGPGIGAPDGTHYVVLYTVDTVKATPLCGYNSVGFPKNARYSVEYREYTTYSKGIVVARWQEPVELFKGCQSV